MDISQSPESSSSQSNLNQIQVKEGLKFCLDSNLFKDIKSTSEIFVDKTLFIKEIIEISSQVILFTRPRKWGKTFNINMLKIFFQPDVYPDGFFDFSKPNKNMNWFYSQNSEGKGFTALKISNENSGEYLKLQGQFPVIYFSFKDLRAVNYYDFLEKLSNKISQLFHEHIYILNSLTDQKDIQKFQDYLNQVHLYHCEFQESLYFLSKVMYNHFNKDSDLKIIRSVYILIEEYDNPSTFLIFEDLLKQRDTNDTKLVTSLIIQMIKFCTNENQYINKIILTGVTNIFSELQFEKLKVFDITNEKFANFFGFTDDEIKNLVTMMLKPNQEKYDKKLETILNKIRSQYNGYFVNSNITLYNPWAVMKYFSEVYSNLINYDILRDPRGYWVSSGKNLIIENLHVLNVSEEFINKLNKISANLQNTCKLKCSSSVLQGELLRQNQDSQDILTYLLMSNGYLTKTNIEGKYRIPNKETQSYVRKRVLNAWIQKKFNIPNIIKLTRDFKNFFNNSEKLENFIQIELLNNKQIYKQMEPDFQGLLRAIFSLTFIDYHSTHYTYSDYALYNKTIDNIYFPREGNNESIFIHEYMQIQMLQPLEKILEDILWYTYSNCYIQIVLRYQADEIRKRSLKFIVVRPIVICHDIYFEKFIIKIQEFKHTSQEAEQINNMFRNKDGSLKNEKVFVGTFKEKKQARLTFLKDYQAKSIYDLVLNKNNKQIENLIINDQNQYPTINDVFLPKNKEESEVINNKDILENDTSKDRKTKNFLGSKKSQNIQNECISQIRQIIQQKQENDRSNFRNKQINKQFQEKRLIQR